MFIEKPKPGTISRGTHHPVHLWEVFRTYLDQNMELVKEGNELYEQLTEYVQDWEIELELQRELNDVVHEAMEHLESIAPAGHYFGVLAGDSSEYGFWPLSDQ